MDNTRIGITCKRCKKVTLQCYCTKCYEKVNKQWETNIKKLIKKLFPQSYAEHVEKKSYSNQ